MTLNANVMILPTPTGQDEIAAQIADANLLLKQGSKQHISGHQLLSGPDYEPFVVVP